MKKYFLILALAAVSCSKSSNKVEPPCKTCTSISQGQTFTAKDCDGLADRDAQGNWLNWSCR